MKTIIVDIDGTLTKVGDRVKYLKIDPPDWASFYDHCDEDEPVNEMIDIVNNLSKSYFIVLCSGRRESCRKKTEEFFKKHGLKYDNMIFRKDGDVRHDSIAKHEMLQKSGIKLDNVAFILEDRNSMVKKWRELGFVCLQVAEGDF